MDQIGYSYLIQMGGGVSSNSFKSLLYTNNIKGKGSCQVRMLFSESISMDLETSLKIVVTYTI